MNRARWVALLTVAAVAVVAAVLLLRGAPPPRPFAAPRAPDAAAGSAPDAASKREVARAPRRTVAVEGRWGSGPGELGRSGAADGNLEVPMAVAVSGRDTLVLDQQNGRVQRFSGGRVAGSFPAGTAAQDLVALPGGGAAVLDRLGAATLTLLGEDGKVAATIPLVGGPIREGGAVTGVFADAEGVYVEREHRDVVRLADGRGRPDPARPTLWGRPTRDGKQLVRAALADRAAGTLTVSVASRENGAMDFATTVTLDGPILHLVLLDSDRHGRLYVAGAIGRPGADGVTDERVAVVRLERDGSVSGRLSLPALPEADEIFRPLAVDDEGAIYELLPGTTGLSVVRFEFP